MMIDTHIHADTRSSEDFKKMSMNGIGAAISCSFYPLAINSSNLLLAHFDRLINYEVPRAADNLLNLYLALGIHPKPIPEDYEKVLEKLPLYLEQENVICMGEIGLDQDTPLEQKVFKKQLKIAAKLNKKVIVHTPRKNKPTTLEHELEILESYIRPELVVIDHLNMETIPQVINTDYTMGLTIQPHKLEPTDIIGIVNEYGCERFILNSDSSHMPSNPISVAEAIYYLKKEKIDPNCIESLASGNARKFFQI